MRTRLLLAVTCLLVWPVVARAVPTVRGATGLVLIPNAALTDSATIYTKDGKVNTGGTKTLGFAEGGVFSRDGRTFYDAKIQILPDITSDDEWIPGIAVGMRGVGSQNDQREYYGVIQKKFTNPKCTLVWGMNKLVDWSGTPKKAFYGGEFEIFNGLTLLADHENQLGSTNVGARYNVSKVVCVYDFLLDMKGVTPAPKENIVGACYQKHF